MSGPDDDELSGDLLSGEAMREVMGMADTTNATIGEIGEPIPCPFDSMPSLLTGARSAGMVQAVCHNCGRPWLTKPKMQQSTHALKQRAILFMQMPELPPLCPLCDPDHIAYQPEGPPDRERWFNTWRGQLLRALAQRSAPRLLLVPRSVWVPDVPLALYECRPQSGGEITAWYSRRYGQLPWGGFYRDRLTFAGGAYLTGWFPAGDQILARMDPAVQPDPKRRAYFMVPFTERPIVR